MKTQGQVILGVVLIAMGLLAILDRWLNVSLGQLFFPLLLIALGAWIVMRPSRTPAGIRVSQQLLGDVVRKGAPADEDVLILLGDVKVDWRSGEWPSEPVHLRVTSVLGDVRVKVLADVGVSLESRAAISSVRLDASKKDGFFVPIVLRTEGYDGADRRLELKVVHLLGDVRVQRGDQAF
jgi:hypothetical protein